MEQFDLQRLLATSYDICRDITRANVGNVIANDRTLQERLHDDLLAFGAYVADAEGRLGEEESRLICECLGHTGNQKSCNSLIRRARANATSMDNVPHSLKFAVLAAAGKKLQPDPYKGQTAMVFYDTFRLLGQTVLASRKRDVSDTSVRRFSAYMERMEKFIKNYSVWYAGSQKYYRVAEPTVEDPETAEEKQAKLEELLAGLDALVGLTGVKEQVHDLVNLIQVQKMREELGMKTDGVSKHMVFSGNPGTGKTTVARMLAEIYHYLGVLRTGQLVEVDRSGLVRGYVGQTATRVQEVVEQALGGILFVDEAYALTVNKGENDFGQEAVDTLLKAMEDNRDDLVVIVAGYTDLMEKFLNSNPGLRSRFSNFIQFDDYTADELVAILHQNLEKREYRLSEAAEIKARELIEYRVAHKPENFANARDVRNFMEHAISNHATRVIGIKEARGNKDILGTIEADDLEDWKESSPGSRL